MSKAGRKRHSPEQIIKKLRDADALLNSGSGAAEPADQREYARAVARAVRRHEGAGREAPEGAGG